MTSQKILLQDYVDDIDMARMGRMGPNFVIA